MMTCLVWTTKLTRTIPGSKPLLHYKAVARTKLWRYSDIALCIFGFVAMAYTTSLTVISWANSGGPDLPRYCDPS
jgi:proton-coupled amino acid transporter